MGYTPNLVRIFLDRMKRSVSVCRRCRYVAGMEWGYDTMLGGGFDGHGITTPRNIWPRTGEAVPYWS